MIITPIKYALHKKDESPIFGTDTIHLTVNDDATGYFYTIEQICPSNVDDDSLGVGRMTLDTEEIYAIANLVKKIEAGIRLTANTKKVDI